MKNRFSGGYLGLPIDTILAIFNLQVTPMLLTDFQVKRPFGSGGEVAVLDFRSEQF